MSIKGFTSSFNAIGVLFNGVRYTLKQIYATVRHLGSGKVGLMTSPMWLSVVSSGNTLDASGSTKRVLSITGHSLENGSVIRFINGLNAGQEVQVEVVIDADTVFIGQELPNVPAGSDGFTIYRPMTPTLDSSGQITVVEGITTVVDFLDSGSFAPTGANVIPRSSSAPLEVVSSLAAPVTRAQVISDIGEFINMYSDSAGTNLLCHLPLTPDETVDVDIPAGSTLYLRNAKDVDIDDANSIISINFIG